MGKQKDSGITWTDETWNPIRGCTRVSEGCRFCYAERVASRFNGPGQPYEGLAADGKWTGKVKLIEDHLTDPLRWTRPRRVFVNSMSDLFHSSVPDEWIDRIFAVMALAPQHTFQVLTKRPERMRDWMLAAIPLSSRADLVADTAAHMGRIVWDSRGSRIENYSHSPGATAENIKNRRAWVGWPLPNVWLGVSVEDQKAADTRIPLLLSTPAAIRWISAEPLLGPLSLCSWVFDRDREIRRAMNGPAAYNWYQADSVISQSLDWVVIGGESGPEARPMNPSWVSSIVKECQAAGTPVHLKQWGEWAPDCLCQTKKAHRAIERPAPGSAGVMFRCGKKNAGRMLRGKLFDEFPKVAE